LEKKANKYLSGEINYGKAAKRMYNIFRLTGRYEEAAYIHKLFDEPTSVQPESTLKPGKSSTVSFSSCWKVISFRSRSMSRS
jgi:hypothetical protein